MSKVLVFDSGVGGLSIWQELQKQMPGLSYDYLGDLEFFPYGTKTDQELIDRVGYVLDLAVKKLSPDLIVVACNTASTIVLPYLRVSHTIPIVGVVPAVKPAAALSQTKCIGLLATPATVNRPYTDALIKEFAADCLVIKHGPNELAQMAEDTLRGLVHANSSYVSVLAPFAAAEKTHRKTIDAIVLACTHFPLVKTELAKAWGRPLQWVDSGEAIARRVRQLLGNNLVDSTYYEPRAWFTKIVEKELSFQDTLSALGFYKFQKFPT